MPLPFATRRDPAAHAPIHGTPAAPAPLHAPAAKTLDAINALDQGCVWPTHRLRCFLQLQHSQAFAGSR